MRHGLPVVTIVGRPNTGKSSLFNLLLGERKSIVDETEGVTRDINIGRVKTPRSVFLLYDTAGYLEKGDSFNELVQKKVRDAIEDTDLILFVVDGLNYHSFDEDLARMLRRQEKPVIVVANKLDNRDMEARASEFYQLGFETVLPFSVAHKRGYNTILEMIEDGLADRPAGSPAGASADSSGNAGGAEEEIRIAIVGRPNVGKSRLLNTILGYDRSIVSDIPGTTRDSLDDVLTLDGKRVRLIDTAGLRRKSRVEGDIEYYSNVRAVQAVERSHVVILVLDAGGEIAQQDKHILEMVLEKGRGLVIAVNKWDLKKTSDDQNYRQMEDMRRLLYGEIGVYGFVPMEFISAQENYRVEKLLKTAFRVYNDFVYRVPTAKLNEWLEREIRESDMERPVSNLKVYYATQVASAPPKFVFFVNDQEHLRKDFPRYLEKKLRLAFEFAGVPVKLDFQQRKRSEADRKKGGAGWR